MKILLVTGRPGRRHKKTLEAFGRHLEHAGWRMETRELPSFLAAAAREIDADDIGIAGGDGTVKACLASLGDRPLLVVPAGTGNDLARSLNIFSITDAVRALRCGQRTRIDLLKARHDGGEETGANGAGIGMDGRVAARKARGWSYTAAAAAAFLEKPRVRARVEIDGMALGETEFFSLVVANGEWFGGGYRLAPRARLDDGQLDLVAIRPVGPLKALSSLHRARRGEHLSDPAVLARQGRRIVVESSEPMPWHLDGEPRLSRRIEFEVLPRAVQAYVLRPS